MSNLADLLVEDSETEAVNELHPLVAAVRKDFPGNQMVPMINRIDGKPSERVRLRGALKALRAEGMRINCPDQSDREPHIRINAYYHQSGKAYNIQAWWIGGDSPKREVEMLRKLQETLHEYSLPILATRPQGDPYRLHLQHCDENNRPWFEVGMDGSWAEGEGMDIAKALAWREVFGEYDSWLVNYWIDAGWKLEDVKPWYAGGDGFNYPEDAEQWRKLSRQGITPKIAIQLNREGISAEQAKLVRKLWKA